MATSTHTPATQQAKTVTGLFALWHLISLDAPTIAALWFLLAARVADLHLHAVDAAALALGTWMLYAIDRVLDARFAEMQQQEERHRFHGVHRGGFLFAMVCAAPLLIVLLMHMEWPLLRGYLLLGVAMAAYFAAIHTRKVARRVPKELAVGVVFAIAIFMPELLARTWACLPMMLCFGVLCWLNCTAIYQREHSQLQQAQRSTRFAMRNASLLLAVLAMAAVIFIFRDADFRALSVCILLSAVLLTALHRWQERVDRLAFRVAADAALLTPLLAFLLLAFF